MFILEANENQFNIPIADKLPSIKMLMYKITKKPQWMQLRVNRYLDIILLLQTYFFKIK